MPTSLTASYGNLKSQIKIPIWMFSGLALVAILITIGIVSDKQNDEKNAQLILTPKSGDIFEIKTKDSQYTLYKVDKIAGDSVFIQINNYEVNKLTGLNDLKNKDYSSDTYGFSKNELKEMFAKGEIINIDRE